MHEFSLCQSIVSIVAKQVKASNFEKVTKVTLEVGNLSGVDLDSLIFWMPTVAKGTLLDNVEIKVDNDIAKAKCKNCGNIFEIINLFDACHQCNSYEKDILNGQQMNVKSIEVK